jgi:hypothetical protein
VEQEVLRGWQCPPLQFPPQHSAEPAHTALSAVQLATLAQTARAMSHCRLQQSVATAHELPGPLHVVTEEAHLCDTGSHDFEQHCAFEVQATAATVHRTFAPPVPGAPACPLAPPVPVLSVLTVLLPQPGIASNPAKSRTAAAAIEREVGEGFMMVRATGRVKRLTTDFWRILPRAVSR